MGSRHFSSRPEFYYDGTSVYINIVSISVFKINFHILNTIVYFILGDVCWSVCNGGNKMIIHKEAMCMHVHQKQSRLVDNKLSLTNVRTTVCVIISNVTSSITIIQNSTRSSGGKFGSKSSSIFSQNFLKSCSC